MPDNTVKIMLQITDDGSIKIFDQVKEKTDESTKATDSWTSSLKAHAVAIGLSAAGITMMAREVDAYLRSSAAASDAIRSQSQILGVTTTRYQELQYAARMSGVSNEEFSLSMKMLARSTEEAISGESRARQIFSAMGISVEQLRQKRPDQIFEDMSQAMSAWEDGGRKVDYAMTLMGRSAERMIPQMNKGKTGLRELADEAHNTGKIVDDALIKKGAEAQQNFNKLAAGADAFKLSLSPVAALLGEILLKLSQLPSKIPKAWDFEAAGIDPLTGLPIPKGPKMSEIVANSIGSQWPSESRFGLPAGTLPKPPPLPPTEEERWKTFIAGNQSYIDSLQKMADAEEKVRTEDEAMNEEITKELSKRFELTEKLRTEEEDAFIKRQQEYDVEVHNGDAVTLVLETQNKITEDAIALQQALYEKKKAVAETASEYFTLTGDPQKALEAYAAQLRLEEQNLARLVAEGKASQQLLDITKALNDEKIRRKEAVTNLNIPALYDIGMTDAAVKANEDLANQYANLLPNSIDVFTNAIRQSDGSLKSMFENAAKGFLIMGEQIMATIIKMEILAALGYGSGNTGYWGAMVVGAKSVSSGWDYSSPSWFNNPPLAESIAGASLFTPVGASYPGGEDGEREFVIAIPKKGKGEII